MTATLAMQELQPYDFPFHFKNIINCTTMQQLPFSMTLQQQQSSDTKQTTSQSVNNSYYRQYQHVVSSFEQVLQKIVPIDKLSKQQENADNQQLKQQIKIVLTQLTAKINEVVVFQQRLANIVNDSDITRIIPQIDQITKMQVKLQTLQAQLQAERQQCQYLQVQVADFSQKYEVTKRELQHRNAQHGAVEKMADRQILSFKRNIQQLELEIKQLRDEKAEALAAKERMSQDLGRFQTEMDEKQTQYNQQMQSYKERIYQLINDGKEQLLQQNKQNQNNITLQKAENERLHENMMELQAKYGEARAQLKTQSDRIAVITAERDDYFKKLREQRRHSTAEISRLENLVNEFRNRNEELELKLDEKENAAAGLRAEFGGSSRTELAQALRVAEATAAEERLRAEHLKQSLAEAVELRDAARHAAQQARLEAEEAQNLAKERKEQQSWAQSSATRIEATNLIASLKHEIKTLRAQLESSNQEVSRLKSLTSSIPQSRFDNRTFNNSDRNSIQTSTTTQRKQNSISSPSSRFVSIRGTRGNLSSINSYGQQAHPISRIDYRDTQIESRNDKRSVNDSLANNQIPLQESPNKKQEESVGEDSFDDSSDGEKNNLKNKSNSFDDFDNGDNDESQSKINVSQIKQRDLYDSQLIGSPSKMNASYTDNMFENYTELNFIDDPDSPGVFLDANRSSTVQSKRSINTRQSIRSNVIPKDSIKVKNINSKDAKFIGSISSKNVSPVRQIQVNKKESNNITAKEKEKKIKEIVFQPPLKNF